MAKRNMVTIVPRGDIGRVEDFPRLRGPTKKEIDRENRDTAKTLRFWHDTWAWMRYEEYRRIHGEYPVDYYNRNWSDNFEMAYFSK